MRDLLNEYAAVLNVLDERLKPLQAEYAAQMQCRRGCSACCIDGFRIRYVEALRLFEAFANASPEIGEAILENLAQPAAPPGTPSSCPLLVEGACSLYAARPALCRAFGLVLRVGAEPATCSLNFQDLPPTTELKVFDLMPYYAELDALSESLWAIAPISGAAGADALPPVLSIREYFQHLLSYTQSQS